MSRPPIPVTIRGNQYPSITAAAKVVGVTPCVVSRARKNGTLDSVGLGEKGAPGHPTVVAGRAFPSQNDAAAFLGVSPQMLHHWKAVNAAIQAKTEGDQ